MKISETYNLQAMYPEVAKQWHPDKNGNLVPSKVTPGSRRKIWWVCEKGHEWQAIVERRTNGSGCPHCYRSIASDKYNLAVINPELAKQWHSSKNGKLTPEKVTPGMGKKVWWVCEKGHEWQALIVSRNKGIGCPYCTGKKANKENSLAALHPELSKQWHPNKNGELTPDNVTPGSGKKAWWICENGHEWKARIASRSKGFGCPHCVGLVPLKKEKLSIACPDLAKQWNPTKNGDLTPDMVTPGMDKKVWWICEKGHEWEALIANRSKGNGCPYCAGRKVDKSNSLASVRPDLAKEWHPEKNGGITPEMVTPGSSKKVWWRCDQGHEWRVVVANRNKGTGCPFCSGRNATKANNLLLLNPQIAKQWHPTKNGELTPDKVTPYSGKKVWWKCEKGHEWVADIGNRNKGSDCPVCSLKRRVARKRRKA